MLALSCPPLPSPIDTSEGTRKRRRKTSAGGASSDCHRCSQRNRLCDRRRPYCSQCLEIGDECSGYKTQLTWGVGVASRGKLRGLSLPVATSAPAVKDEKKPARPNKRTQSLAVIPTASLTKASFCNDDRHDRKASPFRRASLFSTQSHVRSNDQQSMFAVQEPHLGTNWMAMIDEEDVSMLSSSFMSSYDLPGRHSHSPDDSNSAVLSAFSEYIPVSPSCSGGFGGPPFMSSMNVAAGMESAHLHDSVSTLCFSEHDLFEGRPYIFGNNDQVRSAQAFQGYFQAESAPMDQQIYRVDDEHTPTNVSLSDGICVPSVFCDEAVPILNEPETSLNRLNWPLQNNDYVTYSELSTTLSSYPSYDLAYSPLDSFPSRSEEAEVLPRLQYYLSYYERIICPAAVAIDTPSNPYRRGILELATYSEGLQHAICALSACNLRLKRKQCSIDRVRQQRRKHGRQDPFDVCFHRSEPAQPQEEYISGGPSDEAALREEHHHRNMAITFFNTALNSSTLARHDSVLATLFILCHYRMCESGVAQFKTQFTGAKKLMGMREAGIETSQWGWMETAFTFYDALSATINEREAQLRGGYIEMISSPQAAEHALENFAGLDGGLFKIIANLGRLNLLSQQRDVLPRMTNCSSLPVPPVRAPRPRLNGSALANYFRDHPTSFDGNGFATTIMDPLETNSSITEPHESPLRSLFITEWQSIREALETWSFDRDSLLQNLPHDKHPISEIEIRDFNLVSEAFRYAALLYTEKLVSPSAPPDSHSIQRYVYQTLTFVSGLSEGSRLERFLLWPCFVAGSEAREEGQWEIVRDVCGRIQRESGYANDGKALEVLERIWKDCDVGSGGGVDDVDDDDDSNDKSTFRWTKYLKDIDGELIVV